MRKYVDTDEIRKLNVGDKFYYTNVEDEEVQERIIMWKSEGGSDIKDNYGYNIHLSNVTYAFFVNKETAEEQLKILVAEKQKRKLLKKYEKELNEKFGLDTFMVK